MSMAFKSNCFLHRKRFHTQFLVVPSPSCRIVTVSARNSFAPMASLVTVSETFDRLRQQNKVALISYITASDPDLSTTAEALKVLDSCGSDIIELGVPHTDPWLDGPVIQVVPQLSCPIALFSYYNPILKRGTEKSMSTMKDVGVTGLLVPDVPFEETRALRKQAVKYGIELVLFTTPTTPKDRMKELVEASEGFIYLVSCNGVTGARSAVSGQVQELLTETKEVTDKPVAVGFGISNPEHVRHLVECGADGVIIGSAMVKRLGEARSPEEGLKQLEEFTKSMKSALI